MVEVMLSSLRLVLMKTLRGKQAPGVAMPSGARAVRCVFFVSFSSSLIWELHTCIQCAAPSRTLPRYFLLYFPSSGMYSVLKDRWVLLVLLGTYVDIEPPTGAWAAYPRLHSWKTLTLSHTEVINCQLLRWGWNFRSPSHVHIQLLADLVLCRSSDNHGHYTFMCTMDLSYSESTVSSESSTTSGSLNLSASSCDMIPEPSGRHCDPDVPVRLSIPWPIILCNLKSCGYIKCHIVGGRKSFSDEDWELHWSGGSGKPDSPDHSLESFTECSWWLVLAYR